MKRHTLALLSLAALLAGCGGGGSTPSLDLDDADSVVISRPEGTTWPAVEVTLTDPETIEELVAALEEAQRLPRESITEKFTTINVLAKGKSLAKIPVSGSVFEVDEREYSDDSLVLARILNCVLERQAALIGDLTCDGSISAGSAWKVEYAVKNAGHKPLMLARTFRLDLYWVKILEGEESFETTEEATPRLNFLEFEGGDPVKLEPGGSHTFTFELPTRKLGFGSITATVGFRHPEGTMPDPAVLLPPPALPRTLKLE